MGKQLDIQGVDFALSVDADKIKERIAEVSKLKHKLSKKIREKIDLESFKKNDFFCGTCLASDKKEHPKSGECWHCKSNNWINEEQAVDSGKATELFKKRLEIWKD